MQLIFLLITWLVCVSPFKPSTNVTRPTQTELISTADYVGTWVGHSATGEFKLVLEERKNYRMVNNRDYDIIVGWPYFTAKGSTHNESLPKSAGSSILVGMFDSRFPGQLSAGFQDEINHKSVDVKLSFADASRSKILWQVIGENEYVITKPGAKFLPGLSVPTSSILEKVKQDDKISFLGLVIIA